MAPDQRSRVDKLRHMQRLLREMKDTAEAERCRFLSHLLEMAYLESGEIIRAMPVDPPPRRNGFT
jgi:hypothetical protein